VLLRATAGIKRPWSRSCKGHWFVPVLQQERTKGLVHGLASPSLSVSIVHMRTKQGESFVDRGSGESAQA